MKFELTFLFLFLSAHFALPVRKIAKVGANRR